MRLEHDVRSHVTRHTSHVTRHTSHVTRRAMATAKTPAETTRGQDDERAGDGTAADD